MIKQKNIFKKNIVKQRNIIKQKIHFLTVTFAHIKPANLQVDSHYSHIISLLPYITF